MEDENAQAAFQKGEQKAKAAFDKQLQVLEEEKKNHDKSKPMSKVALENREFKENPQMMAGWDHF